MAIPYLTSAMYDNNMYPGIACFCFYQKKIFVYELWHSIIVRLLSKEI